MQIIKSKRYFSVLTYTLCLCLFASSAAALPRISVDSSSISVKQLKTFADKFLEAQNQIIADKLSSSAMSVSPSQRQDPITSGTLEPTEPKTSGQHYHYNYHVAYPCTNPNNLPGAPASIDLTFGPYCSCSSDFDFAAHCASDKALVENIGNQAPSDEMCAALAALGIDCPDTVGEVYGCGPFVCEKTNITPKPGTC